MVPNTVNFGKIANSKKSRGASKKKSDCHNSGYPYTGEKPAVDTLSPVTKGKKKK